MLLNCYQNKIFCTTYRHIQMKTHAYYLLLLCFLLITAHTSAIKPDNNGNVQLIVQTTQGKVKGFTDQGISIWKGIRYAKAPVGDLRFRAPQPADAWDTVQLTTTYGTDAPQSKSRLSSDGPQSEDCLFLNIWSPAADGKKRPVMFWIHGGGFVIGSGAAEMYDGKKFAATGDVVLVTINYRLGPLGFLYFGNAGEANLGFENNLGIRDQIAALKWVKENIAQFGGDPSQVTIFGESAGGTSVETLLATKSAKGLFKRAIAESGPAAMIWQPQVGLAFTQKFLSILGINPDSLHLLKTLPVDTIRMASDKLGKYMVQETNNKVFAPTIDGSILTNDIFSCLKPEQSGDVALMIGTNKNEITMFASKKLKMAPRNAKQLDKYFDDIAKGSKAKVTSAYSSYPKKSGVSDILTDAVFRIPCVRLAECQSQHAPVYMYRFEWTSFALNAAGLKSFHGLEIPFVFGNTDNGR